MYVLVVPAMVQRAAEEAGRISLETGLDREKFHIIEGDITKEGLGIEDTALALLERNITHVFHLAAIYDLAVPREIAYKVNVKGTENVNAWVKALPLLERYIYFSTAYVAGLREGRLLETELVKPPRFKNHYEETKYEAEVLVEGLKKDVPVTIIRPGIVKGHSKTGGTIKFDGPYFILNFLDRLRLLPIIPRLGRSNAVINLVPIDFIIAATAHLALKENAAGKTYHLTDPNPYRVEELYGMLMEALLGKRPKGTLPLSLAKAALSLPHVRKMLGVEKEALDYFTWQGHFDCSQALEDLKGSGIHCPDFQKGVNAMVKFYNENKHNRAFHVDIR
ncbi:Male sterility domain-containing protein [Bacillus sp. B-jedd]|nr:Male sterility domain-containing protein [Bacillus sp. B-jedd]